MARCTGLFCITFQARGLRAVTLVPELDRLATTVQATNRLSGAARPVRDRTLRGGAAGGWRGPADVRPSARMTDLALRDGPLCVRAVAGSELRVEKSFAAYGGGADVVASIQLSEPQFLSAMRFSLSVIASGMTEIPTERAVEVTGGLLRALTTESDRTRGRTHTSVN